MTPEVFLTLVAAAKAGKPQAFNRFYKKLYKECKANLLFYVSTETEAEDAFSEAMHNFWKKFIIKGDPLPDNIKGYIFKMAKFYSINLQAQQVRNENKRKQGPDIEKNIMEDKTEADFWAEQSQEDNYQSALKKGIKKLGKNCRELFEYILKYGKDKPKDIHKALGYKNARTVSTVKSDCKKALKIKVAIELDVLNQLKPTKNVNYN